MDPEQKRLLDGGILLQLHAAYPSSLSPKYLGSNLRLIGGIGTQTDADLDERLRYLEREDLVQREDDPGFRAYLITDKGRSWLDDKGLI